MIECKRVTKLYGNNKALNDMSFTINEGKITGLIGRNGAGKTTLLKTIAGYLKPTFGEILVHGMNPFNNLAVSQNLIFVDDNMAFHNSLTLKEILNTAKDFYPNWQEELANGLCRYFNLDLNKRHNQLSKGMKSTFNSVIGISSHCDITIYDEPTTGMDSAVRKDFYKALLKDYIDFPRTIILSSHLLGEIEEILEDILLVKAGKDLMHLSILELKEYAIGLKGSQKSIDEFAIGRECIHSEEFAPGNVYRIYKNNFEENEIEKVRLNGIEVSQVSADELCIYLTADFMGGITDVFKRS